MTVLLASLAALTVGLVVVGLFRSNRNPDIERRVHGLRAGDGVDPYSTSFADRVLRPAARRVGRLTAQVLPSRIEEAIRSRLVRAGEPISLQAFVALWLTVGVGLPVLVFMVVIALGGVPSGRALMALGFWALIGLGLPLLWLRHQVKSRSRQIARTLPDAIDLIVTNIEAGLGLQAAMMAVADKYRGPISEEFRRTVRDTSMGRPRSESLMDMAARSGVPDMRLFAHAIAQAERTGISIGNVLRAHARESRQRRHQRAREQAGKIPVKMTIPTGLFIFPTILLLILGPVGLSVLEQFSDR